MEDFFKKFVYTGVGWISITADKFKKTINKFVDEGKISSEDGKKIVDDFLKSTDTKKEELEEQFKGVVNKVIKSLSFAKKDELKDLEKRLANLEAKLAKPGQKTKTTRKKTTKKDNSK